MKVDSSAETLQAAGETEEVSHAGAQDSELASAEATDASPEEVLLILASTDIERFRNLFSQTRKIPTAAALRACLRHLAEHGTDEAGRIMLPWITGRADYVIPLTDPQLLTGEKASQAMHILRQADPRFFLKLQELCSYSEMKYDQFLRAIDLCEELGDASKLVPWYRNFADHPDRYIRSRAVRRLCELLPKLATVERQLKSKDARVRANAIEALWSSETDDAVWLFHRALLDTHHRVVVNGLVGLYRRNFEGAFERLAALANHESPMMRAAAAWGLGEVADPRGIPVLERLAEQDRVHGVRLRASTSLAALTGTSE